jgi:feruloyl esterase
MAGLRIPPDRIGLPTSGAVITDARTVPPAMAPGSPGEHCALTGEIQPVDAAAPAIRFAMDLPAAWNRKMLMFGGGAYNGVIPQISGQVPAAAPAARTPLELGYATVASDSGHQTASPEQMDAAFALNDESLRNFFGDALKKTRDAAAFLIRTHYGTSGPDKAYFAGGSNGGREALTAIQRWPGDWDGAIALYPALNFTGLQLQFAQMTRTLAQPGAYPELAQRQRLTTAATAFCDGFDNVLDGVISNVAACQALFDPATAVVDGIPLRCPGGLPGGPECLSDAQIASYRTLNSSLTLPYALASGELLYPGYNIWGADLDPYTFGARPPAYPMPADAPYASRFVDNWLKYVITRIPDFNTLSFDPLQPGPWQDRIAAMSALDPNNADFTAFRARGGKLLMAHGTADALVSSRASAQYYERVRARMGADITDSFFRYYELPGYGHGNGTRFNVAWDALTALENWVERGSAPEGQLVTDTAGVPGRTRPLCAYPSWPRYTGAGDSNAAGSFVCVTG